MEIRKKEGEVKEIEDEKIIVKVGRKKKKDGWGLREIRMDMDGSLIRIDDR